MPHIELREVLLIWFRVVLLDKLMCFIALVIKLYGKVRHGARSEERQSLFSVLHSLPE